MKKSLENEIRTLKDKIKLLEEENIKNRRVMHEDKEILSNTVNLLEKITDKYNVIFKNIFTIQKRSLERIVVLEERLNEKKML